MEFDYKQFHINAAPLAEGGRYYARAKVLRIAKSGPPVEVKWSGDLGRYPSEMEAFEAAKRWAIQWCDENPV